MNTKPETSLAIKPAAAKSPHSERTLERLSFAAFAVSYIGFLLGGIALIVFAISIVTNSLPDSSVGPWVPPVGLVVFWFVPFTALHIGIHYRRQLRHLYKEVLKGTVLDSSTVFSDRTGRKGFVVIEGQNRMEQVRQATHLVVADDVRTGNFKTGTQVDFNEA